MGLIPRFTKNTVSDAFKAFRQNVYNATLANLIYLGELCVNAARSVNTYRDQTGNLRNSIGYVVVYNGKIVKSGFARSARVTTKTESGKKRTTKGSKDGVLAGRELAKSLASELFSGWALIVVAGMDYALKVESTGKDVLTSAEQLAETELPIMLAALKVDISKLGKPQ